MKHKVLILSTVLLCTLVSSQAFAKATLKSQGIQKLSKTQRTTRLGRAQVLKAKKGEVDLRQDPAQARQWGLKSIQAAKAKALTKQKLKTKRVAIIDTGIDTRHPDLKNKLWRNPGELGKDALGRPKATNGIDDDQNGYIDDVHGWNFVAHNNDLKDHHGHGTHIAGIIGAEGGNGIGVRGVAQNVELMVLKYYDPTATGNDNLNHTVQAIRYAVAMGAHIINYSAGGLEPSAAEKQAVALARQHGILFVAAAGNEGSNSDRMEARYYPADYDLDNIISVTAINSYNQVLSSSNYGTKTVDIAAPGANIYSTLPGGKYGSLRGTSQATAFVSGVAAVLMGLNDDFDYLQVIRRINSTGDYDAKSLAYKTRYKKRLNIYKALAKQDQGISVSGIQARNTTGLRFMPTTGGATPSASPQTAARRLHEQLTRLLRK